MKTLATIVLSMFSTACNEPEYTPRPDKKFNIEYYDDTEGKPFQIEYEENTTRGRFVMKVRQEDPRTGRLTQPQIYFECDGEKTTFDAYAKNGKVYLNPTVFGSIPHLRDWKKTCYGIDTSTPYPLEPTFTYPSEEEELLLRTYLEKIQDQILQKRRE